MDYIQILNNFIYWTEINFTLALLLFFIFFLFYSLFSFPGVLIFIVFAGYLFGIFWSYLICIVGLTLGSFCFFILSKYILSKLFKKFYEKYSKKIHYLIKDSTIEYLIVLRLIPGPPLVVQNILLSLLDITTFKFIISTLIGFSPILLFSIIIGNKLKDFTNLKNFTTKDIFSIDLFILLFLLIIITTVRIFYKKKSIKN